MWLTNGGTSTLVAMLVQDRRGRGLGLQEHDDVPGREGARLRRDRPGHHHPRQDRQDGLQGRRDHRDGLEGHRIGADQILGGEPGPGLLPDDGRRRGRPRQRRRPRVRDRQPGLRARHRLRPAARDLRQADRPAPGDPVPARRDGDQGRDRPRDDGPRRADQGPGRAQRRRGRHGQAARLGVLQRGRRGVVPDPRRLRLLQGVRDRAALPRGGVHADRRGHLRHPEDDHRPRLLKDYKLR